MRRSTTIAAVLALLASSGLAACSNEDGDEQTLTVLAAASLTDVFADLASEFEDQNDGVNVELSFGSSTDLAEQAADGAPGDVLATADETAMKIAEDAKVTTSSPKEFAANQLIIVTPPGNPAKIEELADLKGTRWVRCADDVPCGRVAVDVLENQDVTSEPGSLEEDVRATLDKVTSGEFDAGLVYASDAVAAGDEVDAVEIAGADEDATSYFTAALEQSENGDLAAAWNDLVTSDTGRKALENAGFTLP